MHRMTLSWWADRVLKYQGDSSPLLPWPQSSLDSLEEPCGAEKVQEGDFDD